MTQATSPYLSSVPGVGSTYAQYYAPQLVPAMLGHDPAAAAASPLGVMQQPVLQQKLPRTDRLEVRTPFKYKITVSIPPVVLPDVAYRWGPTDAIHAFDLLIIRTIFFEFCPIG